jgi:porphobilinogen deaminase
LNSNPFRIGYIPALTPTVVIEKYTLSPFELNLDGWETTLIQGEVDTALIPLWQLPLELKNQLTIGALTKRLDTKVCLVKVAKIDSTPKLRDLPEGFKVHSPKEIYLEQLKDIRSDFRITNAEAADYWLLPHFEIGLQRLFSDYQIIFTFQPSELVPIAGSGVWAYVVQKEQIATRKWLASIHHSATSRITNIERGVMKHFEGSSMAIHGIEDSNGYLHFSAFKTPHSRPINYSSATSHGLVYQLVESLNQ